MDLFTCTIGILAIGITGFFLGMTWRAFDVKRQVGKEKLRLELVDDARKEINKFLNGSEMIGSFDYRLSELDSSMLLLIKEIVYDIELAKRMKESKKETLNETNHNR